MSFVLEYPVWFIAICLLTGLLFAYLLYGKQTFIFFKEEKKSLRYILATLRFLAVSLICFLLLSPLIKTTSTEEQKPAIVILQDNSASIKNGFNQQHITAYQTQLEKFKIALAQKYNVIYHQFGNELEDKKQPDFSAQATDIDNAIKQSFLKYDHLNIGAVVLATDGIFNLGNNPVYNQFALKTPIYTIALGDTTVQRDALIRNLLYPDIVYLGDGFNIQIDIEAYQLNGKNTVLEVADNTGKIILNKQIIINQNEFNQTENIIVNASKSGILSYRVRLKTVEGEVIKENNSDIAYIEVIDGRQKILLLYDAPHPDIKAFKYAVESNKNYQIEIEQLNEFNKNIAEYDLIILHGLPSSATALNADIVRNIANSNTSVLYILSAQMDISVFNTLQNTLKISGSSLNGNDVFPIYQNNFSKFTFDEQSLNILKQLPPILSPYGKYETKANTDVLFKQQLGKLESPNPLILFTDENNKKIGIFAGEGWWRWRLNEFMQNKNFDATDALINKTIQYLTVKTDKRKFKINTTKKVYGTNEPVIFEAQLYNESFVLINEPEVNIELKSGENTYHFVFDKNLNAYTLNTGNLPVGDYVATAKTEFKGQNYTASTNFSVKPINLELQNTQANWGMLHTLSKQSGGSVFYLNNFSAIADSIRANKNIQSILFENTQTKPLIDWKIIFGIILLLLSAEWIIRKYNGIA